VRLALEALLLHKKRFAVREVFTRVAATVEIELFMYRDR